MKQNMTDILALIRSGRVQDATDAIKTSLGSTMQPAETATRPVKDVTPGTGAAFLPGSTPKPSTARFRSSSRSPSYEKREHRVIGLPYRLFRPSMPVASAPLIVMLHGCTQNPEDFARGTRMNLAADRIGAHVIWPEQVRSANPNGCWNWFDPIHQGRSGEAAAIAALVLEVGSEVAPGASGIHVAGLSAGGAMAAILGTRYPETFASVGIHSGLPVGAASDVMSALTAMRSGASGSETIPIPAIVFHGAADRTVASANGAAVARTAGGLTKPRRRTMRDGGRDVTVTRTDTIDGMPFREFWEVGGLGHAWSGGDAAGSHTDAAGPDATKEMLRFFQSVDQD